MKRIAVVLLFAVVVIPSFLFAAMFHSIPLGHEVYRIIEVAEIRGIIPVQTDVKPYNLNTVRALLSTILDSGEISGSEKSEINRILADFDSLYGSEPTAVFGDFFTKGFLRTSEKNTTMAGWKVSSESAVGLNSSGDRILDSRNGVTGYVRGDILNFVSYDLNFRVSADVIDINADSVTDLRLNCDGFYMSLLDAKERLTDLPDNSLYNGIESFSEISASFRDDLFSARIGTVQRDWGPGINNIGLSGSARAFDGFEFSIKPASWFSYSVATGSLGLVSLNTVDGVRWPSDNMDDKEGVYYNNISIHRVEIGPFSGFKFAVWESVIWRKRFELSYINPFAIYMFAQNNLGDYDNCIAGFDASLVVPGVGKLYAAFSMDEIYNYSITSNPRNIIALQFGARFPLKVLDFSELGIQATFIPAFFGAHYGTQEKLIGDVFYSTAYVNKGQTLSYPVNPDTLELLANFRTSFAGGWNVGFTVKDQMRSAQYASGKTGTDILTCMSYEASYDDLYEDRAFFNNIWNNLVDAELSVEKKLDCFPISFSFGIRGLWEKERDFVPTILSDTSHEGHAFDYNPGTVTFTSEWKNTFTMCVLFGIKIYD